MRTNFIYSLIITLISIFFIKVSKINTKENFITWFLPFYNKGTSELTSGTPKYLTSNLEYNYLEYDYLQEISFYLLKKSTSSITQSYYDFLFKNITKSAKVKKVNIIYEKNNDDLLKKVNENPFNLAIISSSILSRKMSTDIDLVKNINIIIVSNYRFIFFIANKQFQISRLLEINGKNINLGVKDSDENIFGERIVNNLQLTNDLKINASYDDSDTAFKKLINGQIDGMFYTDLYPSQMLDGIISQDLDKRLVIIPIQDINPKVFKERNIFVEPVSIDLNTLPENYLPVKVKDLNYTVYKPNLPTYRYPDFIVCNKKAEPRLSFNIVNSVVSNLNIMNQSQYFLRNGYNYLSFPGIANSMFFPIHIGAKIFYEKITISTTEPNDFCKFYVGNSKCTPDKIVGAKIITGIDGASEF